MSDPNPEIRKPNAIVRAPGNNATIESKYERLDNASVDDDLLQSDKIALATKLAREGILSLIPGGSALNSLVKAYEENAAAFRLRKIEALLLSVSAKSDKIDGIDERIRDLASDPWGHALLSNIISVIEDRPPDPELIEHLSYSVIKIIEDGKFHALYERHRFSLSIISSLSSQALTLVSLHNTWPALQFEHSVIQGGKLQTPWFDSFAASFGRMNGFDLEKQQRLSHVVRHISGQGLAEAVQHPASVNPPIFLPKLTGIGLEIVSYLSPPNHAA